MSQCNATGDVETVNISPIIKAATYRYQKQLPKTDHLNVSFFLPLLCNFECNIHEYTCISDIALSCNKLQLIIYVFYNIEILDWDN